MGILDAMQGPVSVRSLSRDASRWIRELPGSGRAIPVSRNGVIVGALVETSMEDLLARSLVDRHNDWVSVREFSRGNMSALVSTVADRHEPVVIRRRAQPVLMMVPAETAYAEGLLSVPQATARRSPGRKLDAEELASNVAVPATTEAGVVSHATGSRARHRA